ncbi:MAG TPA: LamG-like jellyroll fold domain-containing protein [Verrucomicrobiae bacterium]|nr:LamG-like jellyroll fold domain-containing protein [Verrucomicrobiae bacterium]
MFVCTLAVVSSPAQNRVLELDGDGSYVELPTNIFQNLTEATVEAWAKWDRFNAYSRVFEFGASFQSMSVFNHANSGDLRFNLYPQFARNTPALMYTARTNGVLRTNEWVHIAAVSGPGGMLLYVNGVLAVRHTNEACLASIKAEQLNLLGRGLARNPDDRDFFGQMDEVRVWNYRRSAEQIRDNMNRRLSGREEGLVGLWNFDDGAATDSSPGAHHGKLHGKARAVLPSLPAGLQLVAAELVPAPPQKPTVAVTATATPTAANRDMLYWWVGGALTVIVVLLAWIVFMFGRRRPESAVMMATQPAVETTPTPKALNAGAGAPSDMKERALAELTEFAKQSLVQGLYSQREALLEVQKKAHRELAEMEARLLALKLPERILAYEKRILELERELDARSGELREVTNATLSLLRQKVEEERQRERATRRFN